MKNYGSAIKKLRKNADITQAQLAKRLNVSAQTVSKWENGINLPDISYIEEMCALFGVTIEEFLRLTEGGVLNLSAAVQPEKAEETPAEVVAPVLSAAPAEQAPAAVAADGLGKRLRIIVVTVVLCAILALTAIVSGIVVAVEKPSVRKGSGVASAKEIYAAVNPSVFCITVQTESDTLSGSGFFIDGSGTAVTNYHVIDGIRSAKVKLYNGEEYDVDKILGHDTVRDIAVIHVNAGRTTPAKLADSDRINTGDTVYAIGYPESFVLGSLDSTMTDGIISKTSYSVGGVSYIQSTVDITHGNSGGVLLNARGEVIGITTAGIDLGNVSYMNLSVPSNAINKVKRDINLSVENYAARYSKKINVTYILDGRIFAAKTICGAESAPRLEVDLTALGNNYADCEFLGWFADDGFTVPFDFDGEVTADVTLYGKLRFKETTVRYAGGNGAQGSMTSNTVKAGESFTLPENGFKRTGYNFAGWKIDGQNYAVGDKVTVDGSLRELLAEAEWAGVRYTVKFAYGGQSSEEEYTYGENHRLPTALYKRTGYTQTGWIFRGNIYGLFTSAPDFTTVENASVTVEPQWTPINYTLQLDFGRTATFEQKEYDYGEYARITGTYGENPLAKYSAPYCIGLEFNGWTVYSADGSVYKGDMRYVNPDPTTVIKVKANWISGDYTLRLLDSEYGGKVLREVNLSGAEEYTLPLFSTLRNASYYKGYHFDCWELDRVDIELDEQVLFNDGDTVSNLMMIRFIFGGGGTRVELNALRAPNEYTIKFDGNGGAGSMESITCVYDEECVLPAAAFVKDGYIFAGWECDGAVFDNASTVLELDYENGAELTFNAIWLKEYEGEGTQTNPYKVGDFEQLANLSHAVQHIAGYDKAHYELTADIDCAGGELHAIGFEKPFTGVFNGNNHVVNGAVFAATLNTSESYTTGFAGYKGLFGYVFGGQILNLGLKNYVIDGADGCGVFAPLVCGYTSGAPLTGCFAEGTIRMQDERGYIAGLVYELCGKAVNCYSVCDFDMTYTYSAGDPNSSYHPGDIRFGGFVGIIESGNKWYEDEECVIGEALTENCYADARVNVSVAPSVEKVYRHYTGLFAAETGTFKNCFATGGITYDCGYDFGATPYFAEIRCFVALFNGYDYYPTYDNVYVGESARIVFTDKVITDVPEPQQKTADENLYSVEWLKENAAFDDSVWQENAGALPTLKAFA